MAEKAKEQKKPDVLIFRVDDIGWYDVSAYNDGVTGYRNPNLDRIAMAGAMFTDRSGQQPM